MVKDTVVGETAVEPVAKWPEAAQRYVQAAGRFTWLPHRSQLQAELAANLYQSLLDHRLSLPESEAWQAALRDFGPPSRVFVISVPASATLWRSALLVLGLGAVTYAAAVSLGWP